MQRDVTLDLAYIERESARDLKVGWLRTFFSVLFKSSFGGKFRYFLRKTCGFIIWT